MGIFSIIFFFHFLNLIDISLSLTHIVLSFSLLHKKLHQWRIKETNQQQKISKLLFVLMEACSDSVVPLFPLILPIHHFEATEKEASASRKRCRALEANGGVQKKEKEKRKEMSESFDVLRSLVPNLSPKVSGWWIWFSLKNRIWLYLL